MHLLIVYSFPLICRDFTVIDEVCFINSYVLLLVKLSISRFVMLSSIAIKKFLVSFYFLFLILRVRIRELTLLSRFELLNRNIITLFLKPCILLIQFCRYSDIIKLNMLEKNFKVL
ncbi:unnamed protein product [Moneuplotes crassus]|uniref:Uncharacterized protein n=1 Tax=Euplotes crassus TaxID=5936 RepID=A0AAD1Y6E6_EUPCR|nr:unnamed protein product [Moneuplotes crassus]